MDITLKRARLWKDWLLISGQQRTGVTESPATTEYVIRCASVKLWSYTPAAMVIVIDVDRTSAPPLVVRQARTGPISGTAQGQSIESLDDLLWQGCVGMSGSPLGARAAERPHHFTPDDDGKCSVCWSRDTGGSQHLRGGGDDG
jgi:hypothetical protein